ncbi:hypothetical protein IE53DRAFT_413039 [Violaceomyces palustris]|uniref:Uncharacterized protein n=1 Tax=Violaceomyces palustris TaxID=1673888 RepID=A0ACD0NNN5_9BASI|nr:hypothetical protein IE53DRAFT_413039 [Violaceomyces palustris]
MPVTATQRFEFPPLSLLSKPSSELFALVEPITLSPNDKKSTFQNWGKSFRAIPARVFQPINVTQCAVIVELARRQGVELRPIGRAHSPSDLPFTKGWAIRMEGLEGLLEMDYQTPSVTVLSGTYIENIHEILSSAHPPLAMSNVGSISEQTLGGLISTATHGTGIHFPIISTYIQEITIICALAGGTQILTCSRTQSPELFNATLCGLGSTGLIVSLKLKVEPAFNLKQVAEEAPVDFIFGRKTSYPAVKKRVPEVSAEPDPCNLPNGRQNLGLLLASGKPIPGCSKEYLPRSRSAGPEDVCSAMSDANQDADLLALRDEEEDEETRAAQRRIEEIVESAQHVRIMWFPQAEMCTVLRANRTLEPADPPASLGTKIKQSVINHHLTELLLFLGRYNNALAPRAVRLIHYLTHPAAPSKSQVDAELRRAERKKAQSKAPIVPPRPAFIDEGAKKLFEQGLQGLGGKRIEASSTEELTADGSVSVLSTAPSYSSSSPSAKRETILFDSGVNAPLGSQVAFPQTGPLPEAAGASEDVSPQSEKARRLTREQLTTSFNLGVPEPLSPYHHTSSAIDKSHKIFNVDCLFPQYTDEWAIPYSRTAAALRAMREWLEEEQRSSGGERLHFPVEIRFTDADGIWLSHAQGRKTCYIGVVQYSHDFPSQLTANLIPESMDGSLFLSYIGDDNRPYNMPVRYRSLFAKFENLMRHYAGRPHWAKAHTCSPQELETLYPHWADFKQTRETYDPEGVFLNPYVRRHIVGQIGDQVDSRVFKSRL